MLSSLVQLQKHSLHNVLAERGIQIEVSDEQCENARSSMSEMTEMTEMTGGTDGNTLDPETITQAQEKVTKAITTSVVKLGTMQEYIIDSLTAAQEALSEYKNEIKKR
jgi:hypothetical protein